MSFLTTVQWIFMSCMQQWLSFFQAKLFFVTSEYLELQAEYLHFKHSSECGLMVLSS